VRGYGRIVALAVVAALLAGIYFYFGQTAEPAQTGQLYAFSAGEGVKEITVTNGFGSFTFSKADGRWALTQPGQYRANQQKAAVMEGYLLDLPIRRALGSELAEYGFSAPLAKISFVTTKNQRQTFLVGNETPSRSQVYLKEAASGKIYVSDIGVVSQFDGSLAAYRDKEVFSIDKNHMAKLTYYKDGVKQVVVEQRNPQDWEMSYPFQAPARFIELNELVVQMRKWSLASFPDEASPDLAGWGLAPPAQSLEVTDAAGKTQRLDFGKTDSGTLYVRAGGDQDIIQLFAVDVDFSILDPQTLLYVLPLKTTLDQVAKIDLDYGGQTVQLALDHTSDPVGISANSARVPYEAFISFFVKYIGLSADGFDPVPAGQAGAPEMVLTTTFRDNTSKTLRLLKRDDASLYMDLDGKTQFYLSRDKMVLLITRLETALAAK
jgi:hypothetical protein